MTAPPLRAVLASEFWPGATARALVSGFRARGWMVDEVDVTTFLKTGRTVLARIEGRLRHSWNRAALQQAILTSVRLHRADVLLTVKGVGIDRSTLETLRSQGVLLANYYPDYHFNDVPLADLALYDVMATTKSFHAETLERIMPTGGAAFIHHGYSPDLHRKLPDPPAKDVDLLYVGNAGAAKAELLIALATALPQAMFRIVGNRWHEHLAGTVLERAIAGHQLRGDYYAAEVSGAKINLAFHMGTDTATGFADLVSTRTFEIPACGGFMLHVDNDEVRSLFDVPSEIDTFVDTADLIAKARYWLDHPEERAVVAARGHARAVPAYSYTERAYEIAAIVERKLGRKPALISHS